MIISFEGADGSGKTTVGQLIAEELGCHCLHFPDDNAVLDVDVPGAAAGAVDTMRGANHFVVLPAVTVKGLPQSLLGVDLVFDQWNVGAILAHRIPFTRARRTVRSRLPQTTSDSINRITVPISPIIR